MLLCYTPLRNMDSVQKPVVLSAHAMDQCRYRGAHIEEVSKAIRTADWKPAELGRWECHLDCPFQQIWNGVWYQTKRIRPVFAEERHQLVVVTVYVYYF